jgi:hypothetical protein
MIFTYKDHIYFPFFYHSRIFTLPGTDCKRLRLLFP